MIEPIKTFVRVSCWEVSSNVSPEKAVPNVKRKTNQYNLIYITAYFLFTQTIQRDLDRGREWIRTVPSTHTLPQGPALHILQLSPADAPALPNRNA